MADAAPARDPLEDDYLDNPDDETFGSADDRAAPTDRGSNGTRKRLPPVRRLLWLGLLFGLAAALALTVELTGVVDRLLVKDDTSEDSAPRQLPRSAVHFVDLPDIFLNLGGTRNQQDFILLRLSLEVDKKVPRQRVVAITPRIIDAFVMYLKGFGADDFRNSSDIYKLQRDLLWRANYAATPIVIRNVLFTELLLR